MSFQPDEIKNLRQALGLTQAKFARKLRTTRDVVASWETGRRIPNRRAKLKLDFFAKANNFEISFCVQKSSESLSEQGSDLCNSQTEKCVQTTSKASSQQGSKDFCTQEEGEQNVTSEEQEQIVTSFCVQKSSESLSEQGSDLCNSQTEDCVQTADRASSQQGSKDFCTQEEGEEIVTSSEGGEQNVNSEEGEQFEFGFRISDFGFEETIRAQRAPAEFRIPNSCKEAALEYLSYGWSVIPLCPPDCSPDKVPWHWRDKDGKPCKCAHPGKVPLVAWTVYQERLPTESEVEQWFSKWPFANVGIVTGRVSKLLVVDFDDTIAIDAIKKLGGFEKTPEVKTGGGGQHNYFQHPKEGLIANFAGKLKSVHPNLEKVDMRASGGQVVAPPSLHVSGNRYVWTVPPNEVSPPSLPKWFIDLLEQKPTECGRRKAEGWGRRRVNASHAGKEKLLLNACGDASNRTTPSTVQPLSPPLLPTFNFRPPTSSLPDNFSVLKKCDSLIKSLWANPSSKLSKKGGPERSDYDWALGRACIERGIRNRDDLATILAHFPHGKYARDGSDYNLALTVESLLKTVPHLSYEDAENVLLSLRKQLNTHIKELKEREVLVLRATPGLGKTTEIIEVIKNSERKVILAEPTKEMARTVFEQFSSRRGEASSRSSDTALLKGRDSTCCMRYSQVKKIAAKGYMPGKVICPGCYYSPSKLFYPPLPLQGGDCCEYFRQFFNPTRVKVTTYEQALELHFAGKLDASLLVLDEDPSRALFQKVEITANQLHFPKDSKYPLPTFGHLIRDTLHEAEEKAAGQTKAFRCREIVSLLNSVAKKRRIKLTNLLRLVSDCIDKVFDQPARLESLKEEEIEALPHAYVGFLAKEMLSEIDKEGKRARWKEGKMERGLCPLASSPGDIWNSRLTLVVSGGRARFILREVRVITVRTPIVVLDAYANKDYLSKLLGRDVRLLMFDAQSHCEVIQIPLNTSKNAMLLRKENLFDDLAAVVNLYPNKKILVYTYLFLKEEVENRFSNVSVEHFWSGRGKDCWRDYDLVIIFGTPEPNPSELFDDARALFADDEKPICLVQSKNDPRKYADSRLQMLREMRREDEIMQDMHRIRPIWGKGLSKKVVVMSQLYCPQLPPDKIIDPQTIDKKSAQRELRKERLSHLIKACLKEYGFYFDKFAVAAGLIKTTGGVVCMQGFDGVPECMDTGFRGLYDGLCEKRGGVGERMDTGLCEPSYKDILIRGFAQTSNDAGSAGYGGNKKEYIANRDAILAEIGVSLARVSVIIDGVWRPYKIWGNLDAAKAFFAKIERQQEEEEKARREYEAEVRRELDEEILRYKDTLDYEEPNI